MDDTKRTVLITGGEGDLAKVLVASFEEANYQVFAPGREEMDVCDEESVARYVGGLDSVDLLVNNAGVVRDGMAVKMSEEDWDTVMKVNLKGAALVSREVLKKMRKAKSEGSHLIHIGSHSGVRGNLGQANYAAAKAGLIGLSASLAKEYGGKGIRSNCVLPGFLETKMSAAAWERYREKVLAEHVLGRLNTSADVAAFLIQLDRMRGVSGQVFQLDSRVGRWN